jgi:hypothetical protein
MGKELVYQLGNWRVFEKERMWTVLGLVLLMECGWDEWLDREWDGLLVLHLELNLVTGKEPKWMGMVMVQKLACW